MNLQSIVLLLQLVLSVLTANPRDPQAMILANQAIAVAQEAIASNAPIHICTAPHCYSIRDQLYMENDNYDDESIVPLTERQYPINPVSPCGTEVCK